MGKASSSKKVARAARAGGSRRSGQRRPLGFPITIAVVIILGSLLVAFARSERNANARPRANEDHWHAGYSVYTCITEPAEPTPADGTSTDGTATDGTATDGSTDTVSGEKSAQAQDTTTTTATTVAAETTTTVGDPTATTLTDPAATTVPATSTTIAGEDDVPGEFQPPLTDVGEDALGIHTHGDNVIHIHPFADSAAGQNATLSVFLDQTGVVLTNDSLTLPSAVSFTEGQTKCQGGEDGIVQVAQWNSAAEAARGDDPNQIFTSDFDDIHLDNGEAMTIAFMPENSAIPIQQEIVGKLEELGAADQQPSTDASDSTDATDATDAPDASDVSTDAATDGTTTTVPGVTSTTGATTTTATTEPAAPPASS